MPRREKLPQPVSHEEFFLNDIAISLRELVGLSKTTAGLVAGQAVYQAETSSSSGSDGGQLPSDFPGRAELAAAGIQTLDAVPRTAKRLKDIHGIGPATATEILRQLGG